MSACLIDGRLGGMELIRNRKIIVKTIVKYCFSIFCFLVHLGRAHHTGGRQNDQGNNIDNTSA